jgi:hypothetical protein
MSAFSNGLKSVRDYAMWRYFVAHLARLGHGQASLPATLALGDV